MKKLLLSSIVLLVIACNTTKQITENKSIVKTQYESLSSFKGDTLSYYQYNFIEHKDKYIGKDITYLLNDFEIPIKSSIASFGGGYGNASGITFSNEYRKESTKRLNVPGSGTVYFITVEFDPVPYKSISEYLKQQNDGAVTKDMYPFFSQYIIKDIFVKMFK